jgi:hypothetical protein
MSLFSDRLFSIFIVVTLAVALGAFAALTQQLGSSAYTSGAYRFWFDQVTYDTSLRDLMTGPIRPATFASSISHGR